MNEISILFPETDNKNNFLDLENKIIEVDKELIKLMADHIRSNYFKFEEGSSEIFSIFKEVFIDIGIDQLISELSSDFSDEKLLSEEVNSEECISCHEAELEDPFIYHNYYSTHISNLITRITLEVAHGKINPYDHIDFFCNLHDYIEESLKIAEELINEYKDNISVFQEIIQDVDLDINNPEERELIIRAEETFIYYSMIKPLSERLDEFEFNDDIFEF